MNRGRAGVWNSPNLHDVDGVPGERPIAHDKATTIPRGPIQFTEKNRNREKTFMLLPFVIYYHLLVNIGGLIMTMGLLKCFLPPLIMSFRILGAEIMKGSPMDFFTYNLISGLICFSFFVCMDCISGYHM